MSTKDMDVIREHKIAVRDSVRSGADLSLPYMSMNVLAAVIASYGLLVNSPAVIIGAMLIAMLLGPITGVSLALVESDMQLLFRGLVTLFVGAAAVCATSYIIGLIHLDVPISREITARTSPNLADLVIALAGGAAGAYATVSPRLSVAVVGVAIATALVPPLCAANILFARGEFTLGSGALLLTFTNIVAIQVSSSIVFLLTGYRSVSTAKERSSAKFIVSNLVSIAILCVLAVVLTQKVHEILTRKIFENTVRSVLHAKIDSESSFLMPVRFIETSKQLCIISAGVVAPSAPTAALITTLEKQLPTHPDGKKIELRLRYAPTIVVNRDGNLFSDSSFSLQE